MFKSLFSKTKAVDDIFDKDKGLLKRAGDWVDNRSYTDEEKSKADQEVRNFSIEYLKALHPFKIVQRILAFFIAGNWALQAILYSLSVFLDEILNYRLQKQIFTEGGDFNSAPALDLSSPMWKFITSDYVFWPMIAVTTLYFTGGVFNSFRK